MHADTYTKELILKSQAIQTTIKYKAGKRSSNTSTRIRTTIINVWNQHSHKFRTEPGMIGPQNIKLQQYISILA
jgi:hypothetical protein